MNVLTQVSRPELATGTVVISNTTNIFCENFEKYESARNTNSKVPNVLLDVSELSESLSTAPHANLKPPKYFLLT